MNEQHQTTPDEDEVDDRIDLWHAGGCPPDWTLQQALGMSDHEYAFFIMNATAIPARPLPEVPRHEA